MLFNLFLASLRSQITCSRNLTEVMESTLWESVVSGFFFFGGGEGRGRSAEGDQCFPLGIGRVAGCCANKLCFVGWDCRKIKDEEDLWGCQHA